MTEEEVWKPKSEEDFLKKLKDDKKIKYVKFVFPDILGNDLLDFTVPSYYINEDIFKKGKGYDGSSVQGQARINESDKNAFPDLETARILPWTYHGKTPNIDISWKEMVVFADTKNTDGTPYEGDARGVLKRALEETKKETEVDTVNIGPELEFFLFGANESFGPELKNDKLVMTDNGQYFKGGLKGEVRKESQILLEMMGYEFEYDHHEVSSSQHEIDMKYLPAVEMADFVMLYKYMVRRVARHHGLFASFMPKPVEGINGNGMHVHQSLFKGGKNIFFDAKNEKNSFLSKKGLQYMAGLMKHMPEMTSILNQYVNSFKRLVPGYEAPVYVAWDPANRSNLIRVPGYEPGAEKATRFEVRSPDPATNPYLAFAVMIRAGVKGMTEEYEEPKPSDVDLFELDEKQIKKLGIKTLPRNLEEAIKLTEKSALVKDTLGEHLFNEFIEGRKKHIADYEQHLKENKSTEIYKKPDMNITKYELETLLPIL